MSDGAGLLGAWHDFFILLGTAAGSLIGAMFVVVSIGTGFLTKDRARGIRAFLTPTLAHLAAVLLGCALALVPSLERGSFALLFGSGSLGGLVYASVIARYVVAHEDERSDRFWYVVPPVIGYAAIAAAVVLSLLGKSGSPELVAAGMAVILIAGIRNAWDLILFLAGQVRGPS